MSDDDKKSENQIATVPPPAAAAANAGDREAFDAATRIGPVPEEIRLLIEEKLAAKGGAVPPAPRLTPPSGVPRPAAVPRASLRPSVKPLTDLKREQHDEDSTMMVSNVAEFMESGLARPTAPPRAKDGDEEEEDSTRMLEPDWQSSSPILNAEKDANRSPASASIVQAAQPGAAPVKKPVTAPTPPVAMQPGMTPEAALAEANKGMSGVTLFFLIIAFFIALAGALIVVIKYVIR